METLADQLLEDMAVEDRNLYLDALYAYREDEARAEARAEAAYERYLEDAGAWYASSPEEALDRYLDGLRYLETLELAS